MRLKPFYLLLVATVFSMATLLSTYAQDNKDHTSRYGGALVWGVTHKPTIINPIYTTYSVSMSLLDLIFNRMVRLNSQGEIEPDIAESWDVSPDGLVYTFHLRKGIKFHDGVECTADDVKFTYKNILNPKNGSPFRSLYENIKEIRVINPVTVRFILNQPSPESIRLFTKEIVPGHILRGEPLINHPFNYHPIGTGPFRFREWDKDGTITLIYNPDYYEGRPFLDTIIVKTYESSEDLWSALMRGEVDFVLFLERKDYEVLKSDPAFKTFAIPADSYYALMYNIHDPLLSNTQIRQALAYAIDVHDIIERTAGGYGLQATGPFHPETLGFDPEVTPFPYDPQKAQSILKEQGWKDKDNDGILEKDNQRFILKVLVDSRNQIYKTIAMILRQQLQSIGIELQVILYDDERTLTKAFIEYHQPQAHLRLFLGNTIFNIKEDWATNQFRGADKLWIYNNPTIIQLFKEGETLKGKNEREKVYQQIHRLLYKEQPACFFYFREDFHAISSRISNVKLFFTLSMPYYTIKNWYIKK
ncbi:MAG: hypothetical protein JXD21_00010 [Candidatus Omnitrophica bacterium]|nr:hypothetical protein [Candidatus Omnitrophota bacterium]